MSPLWSLSKLGVVGIGTVIVGCVWGCVPANEVPNGGVEPSVPAAGVEDARTWFWSKRSWVTLADQQLWERHLAEIRVRAQNRTSGLTGSRWLPIGPRPIGGAHEYSGRVLSIAAHPTDPNTILLGSANGGVWRTADAGQSWTSVLGDMPYARFEDVEFDAVDPRLAYAATRSRIYQSQDSGVTWRALDIAPLESGEPIAEWSAFKLDVRTLGHAMPSFWLLQRAHTPLTRVGGVFTEPQLKNRVLRVDSGGRFATALFEISQPSTTPNPELLTDIVVTPSAPNRLSVLGRLSGPPCSGHCWVFLRSDDGGARWSRNAIAPAPSLSVSDLAVAPSNPDVFAVYFLDGDPERVWLSHDSGATWRPTTSPQAAAAGANGGLVAFDPDNHSILYSGRLLLMRSTDSGVSWGHLQAPHVDEVVVAFDSAKRMLLGSDGGIARYESGRWTSLNRGLDITQAYAVAAHPAKVGIAAAGTQDTGTVQLLGPAGWLELTGGDGGDVAFDAGAGITYTETQWSRGSYSFFRCRTSPPVGCSNGTNGIDKSEPAEFIPSFAVDQQSPTTVWLAATKLYRTDTRGDLWTPQVSASPARFRTVAVAASDSSVVYAGTTDGRIFVSSDRGATWLVRSGGPAAGTFVPAIEDVAVNPKNADIAYLASAGHVYRTINRGQTWSLASRGLPPNLPVNTFAFEDDASPIRVYAGTDIGVYRAIDDVSPEWSYFNDGMPPAIVTHLSYSKNTSTLLAATYGRGIWAISPRFIR